MNLLLDPSALSPELGFRSDDYSSKAKSKTCAVCGKTKLDQMFRHIPDMCDRCFSDRDDMIRAAVERLYEHKVVLARDVKRVTARVDDNDIYTFRDENIQIRDLVMMEW